VDVNHWQPLAITNALDQTGADRANPKFLGPQWLKAAVWIVSQ
jgi:hypothetical protein